LNFKLYMQNKNLLSNIRCNLLLLANVSLLFLLLTACGRGARKSPSHPVFTQTSISAITSLPADTGMIKIGVMKEGLYEITSTDIVKIMPAWANVDPYHIQLTFRGQRQSVWISTQGESYSIRFYGLPSESRYTDENIYMLAVTGDESPLMREKQPLVLNATSSESFPAIIHIEENKVYAPQVTEGDHLFWLSLSGHKKQNFEIDLPKVAMGTGHLRVAVWGSTQSPVELDHHLVVSLNDQMLIDEKWDGAGRRTLEADIPAGLLKEGKNQVLVESPGDTGAAAEINFLDWFEFRYPRLAEADNDFLIFEAPTVGDSFPIHLMKFSGAISIMDVTVPTDTVRITGIEGEKDLVFPAETGHRYLAVGPKGIFVPDELSSALLSPDLRSSGLGADYVIIGPQDLLQPLSPLVDLRTSQGIKVVSIPSDVVYDQFYGGMPEPEAIRAFITYAIKNWQPSPRYLLLVGDATYDPREYISTPEANRLPVLFIQTSFGGETASDVLLGDIDGDMLPDLAVGRIPAQNADQVRTLVNKILAYEQTSTADDWRKKILAIADGQDATFKIDAQNFLARASTSYTPTLYAPEAGVKDAPATIKSYFDEGYGLIAYFGHGSINMWGKDRILMAEDINSLSNTDRLPVVINMTCLTGLFTHPKVTSLTETLLWYDQGGAVAVLAPTSLTLPESQSFLSQALIDTIMQNPNATLGENFLQAQRKLPVGDPNAREVLLTFLLFGDPALKYP
jgi:hypothetical protein